MASEEQGHRAGEEQSDFLDTGRYDSLAMAREILQAEKGEKKACFVVLNGLDAGKVIPLPAQVVVIGRGDNCDVTLQDEGLSRFHAEVLYSAVTGRAVVRDLGSKNGTFMAGKRIEEAELRNGEKILLGRHTVLKFLIQDALEESFQQAISGSATRDALTGVHNRRYLAERLGADLSYARRHRVPLTLVLFDLDHFERINESHGYPIGDQLLVAITRAVIRTVRAEDVLVRFGGEEFLIVAQGTDFDGGRTLGERVRQRIAQEPFRILDNGERRITVTASVAVTTIPPSAVVDSEQALSELEKVLAAAKIEGRNRVAVSILE